MPKDTINNMPLHKKIKDYAEEAKKGLLDRREFLAYATALGATTATAYGLLGLAAPNKVEASDVKKGGTLKISMSVDHLKTLAFMTGQKKVIWEE